MNGYDVVVIGAGHNGLACACYLARAGLKGLVLEMADRIGGAVHTAETIEGCPDYRFDTCSVVHNLINMTAIWDELRLHEAGLEYIETDPFTISFFPDGACVGFYRSVERTCAEIARYSPRDAEAYARFIKLADPIVELALTPFRVSEDNWNILREGGAWLRSATKLLWRARPFQLTSSLLGPYGALLRQTFQTEYARAGASRWPRMEPSGRRRRGQRSSPASRRPTIATATGTRGVDQARWPRHWRGVWKPGAARSVRRRGWSASWWMDACAASSSRTASGSRRGTSSRRSTRRRHCSNWSAKNISAAIW